MNLATGMIIGGMLFTPDETDRCDTGSSDSGSSDSGSSGGGTE